MDTVIVVYDFVLLSFDLFPINFESCNRISNKTKYFCTLKKIVQSHRYTYIF